MISPVLLAVTPSPYASQFIFDVVSAAVHEMLNSVTARKVNGVFDLNIWFIGFVLF